MNCPDFELLSAHADGETTPEEAAVVDQHRARCEACAQQLTNLGFVTRALARPQALPAGFKIQVRPRVKTGWWQKLRDLADSPVVHLVSAQRRRRARFGLVEMMKIMAIFALPIFFMCISPDRSPLLAFVALSALGLMIGLPLRQFSEEVALLASLRRGRCLEEIVGTGTSAQGLLDGLALQGLGQITRAAVTVWPILLLGTLGVPHYWRLKTLQLEVAWLPGLLILFLAGYYLAQLLQVWTGGWPRRLGMLLLTLCPWTLLLFGLPGGVVACLLTGLVARGLAIHELENPARTRAVPFQRRNPLVRGWSQNPIARREMSRMASQMGGNWHRLLLWRGSMAILPAAWGLYTLSRPLEQYGQLFPPAVLLFAALFFVRCANLTLPAVVREREQQSWEILMQTPLGSRTVIQGWLQVCLYSLCSEGLFATVVLGAYLVAIAPIVQVGWAALSLLLLPLAGLTGAYVGLGLSASSRNQREAGQKLMLWCLAAGLGWLLAWGLGQGLGAMLAPAEDSFKAPSPVYLLGPVSLLALLPVSLGLILKARPLLSKLPYSDPGEHGENQGRYSPALIALDLGSLLLLGYGLVAWEALSRQAELSAFKGATLLLGAGLVWLLGLRLPLARLAEWSLGRRFNLLLGIGFGAWLGWATYWALRAVAFKVPDLVALPALESEYGCAFFGLLVGVVGGALASRAPLGTPERRSQLRTRLLHSGLLSAAGLLAMQGLKLGTEVPSLGLGLRLQLGSARSSYHHQLEIASHIAGGQGPMGLEDEKWDDFPSSDSFTGWQNYARRHADTTALQRLRQELPDFGPAQAPKDEWPHLSQMENRNLMANLRTQSLLYANAQNGRSALNCERWALLVLDSRDHLQSERTIDLSDESEMSWILDRLCERIGQDLVEPGLIEQLLNYEFSSSALISSYEFMAFEPLNEGRLAQILPEFVLRREQLARVASVQRAQRLAGEFKLWELSHDGGVELLEGIRYTPLARRRVYESTISHGVPGLAHLWSRREGIALFGAIQLYRRDHNQAWPDNLDQVQSYLPRKARCYLNEAGSFDYAPGVYLGCARGDGSQRIVIYQEAK